jgi:hypothetical protein
LEEKYNKCSNGSKPISDDPASSSTNKTLQSSEDKNSSCSDNEIEFATLESDSVGAPIIIIISIVVSLASILIVQLLIIFFLKQKNTVLQAKLNAIIPMDKVAIPPILSESDEVIEEVNEFYGISALGNKTA